MLVFQYNYSKKKKKKKPEVLNFITGLKIYSANAGISKPDLQAEIWPT